MKFIRKMLKIYRKKIISTIREEDISFGDAYSAFKLAEKKLALYEKNFLKNADSKEVLKK